MKDKTLKKYTLYRLRTKIIEKKYEQNIKVTNDIVGLLENYIENKEEINDDVSISNNTMVTN